MALSEFKTIWCNPISKKDIKAQKTIAGGLVERFSTDNKKPIGVFSPLTGRITKMESQDQKGINFMITITTEFPDKSLVENTIGYLSNIRFAETHPGAVVERGVYIGSITPTFVADSTVDWSCRVSTPLKNDAAFVAQNPIEMADLMGGHTEQSILGKGAPSVPTPSNLPPPPPPGQTAPAASSNLLPILLVGGAAYYFLGKKKKGSK